MTQWEKALNRKTEEGKSLFDGMNEIVKIGAELLTVIAEKKGLKVLIVQGVRTIEYQNKLYAQGRTTAGQVVTRCKGGQSPHNWGLAIDFCLQTDKGDVVWSTQTDMNKDTLKDWQQVVEIAESLGFESGFRWKDFPDAPHLQIVFGMSTAQWQKGTKPTPSTEIIYLQKMWRIANANALKTYCNRLHDMAEQRRKGGK